MSVQLMFHTLVQGPQEGYNPPMLKAHVGEVAREKTENLGQRVYKYNVSVN